MTLAFIHYPVTLPHKICYKQISMYSHRITLLRHLLKVQNSMKPTPSTPSRRKIQIVLP